MERRPRGEVPTFGTQSTSRVFSGPSKVMGSSVAVAKAFGGVVLVEVDAIELIS